LGGPSKFCEGFGNKVECRFHLWPGTVNQHSSAAQDFKVSFKQIHDLWSSRKITHATAKDYCKRSRCLGCERLHNNVCWTEEQELADAQKRCADQWREELEGHLGDFRSTQRILHWQAQYDPRASKQLRFKPLLLQGKTRSGKTRKAISIFGHDRTMVVNCQGLGAALPSLRDFCRQKYSCIVFDEISAIQVLSNKMVFQAGVDQVVLGQSACNQHAYSKWLYGVPMILCSNDFQMRSREDSPMLQVDEEYLEANVVDASLPEGERWFFDEDEQHLSEEGVDSDAE